MAIIESEAIPSGVIDRPTASVTTSRAVVDVRYPRHAPVKSYRVRLRTPAPPDLRVSLELGSEAEAVWAAVPELNLTAEGADIAEAFAAIVRVMKDWLQYLRDADPDLADNLKPQARYVPLLDAPEFSWFTSIRFPE